VALRYRPDLYSIYQWLVRYPEHGPAYVVIHFVGPVAVIVGGLGLIVARFVS
jgi:hypothetical protein